MASIDRLNMLIRDYVKRFPDATVEQMGTYLRRNHPEEYKLFQRVGDVKQNIVNPNFTLGEGSALKYQTKPATNLPAKTTTGPNVTINTQPQPKVTNTPVRWADRFQPPAIRDNTDYTKGIKTNTKTIAPTKSTPKFAGKLGAGAAVLGALSGIPAFVGLADENKPLQDKVLDAVQGAAGIGSLLTLAPHPIAKGLGWLSTAAATGIPIARGALAGNNQEAINPIQQSQAQPMVQQPTQQTVEPAPQVQRVTNTPTEYQLPNINIVTQAPQATDDFYNRANIMQKELGAMTKGAAKNFSQIQAGPTPEQIQAYANILNLRGQQEQDRQYELEQLAKAKQYDNRVNTIGNVFNAMSNAANNRNASPIDLVFRDYKGNVMGQMSGTNPAPSPIYQPNNQREEAVQQQIALQEQAREQQIKNAQEMAKIQDAIALANATGMPINQALGLTGKDVLGYNQDVIQRQTDLLDEGIKGSYNIAQEAMQQTGGLAKEGYNQAGQNARTAANIQKDILKSQIDNAASMERILQQGQNALTLAEYKARTGTTAGYPDYLRTMIAATTNPLMPEEYQMAIWEEAMRKQGILPNNSNSGYYQTDGIVGL